MISKKNNLQVKKFLNQEKKSFLYNKKFMKNWPLSIQFKMDDFGEFIRDKIKKKNIIFGYGAPTKVALLLKLSKLVRADIKFTIEDNSLKINKYIPRSNIKIVDFSYLKKHQPDYVIIFAWNFVNDIVKKMKSNGLKNMRVVVPLPKLKIINI